MRTGGEQDEALHVRTSLRNHHRGSKFSNGHCASLKVLINGYLSVKLSLSQSILSKMTLELILHVRLLFLIPLRRGVMNTCIN